MVDQLSLIPFCQFAPALGLTYVVGFALSAVTDTCAKSIRLLGKSTERFWPITSVAICPLGHLQLKASSGGLLLLLLIRSSRV